MRKLLLPLLFCIVFTVIALAVVFLTTERFNFTDFFNKIFDPSDPSSSAHVTHSELSREEAARVSQMEDEKSAEFRVLSLERPETLQWWHGAVTYQIWPRSFKDSNGDGHGDLLGIVEKLDYLSALGVDAIWLNPIFESNSYHGYDAVDHYQVDTDYGTLADFDTLIAEAHERGIKVLLDLVINHVSIDHPWFKQSANNIPEYRDYFIWQDAMPTDYGSAWSDTVNPSAVWHYIGEDNPWRADTTRDDFYYGVFGYAQPDLNLTNTAVQEEIHKIAMYWLGRGVDGFRLDAVRYLIEEGGMSLQADTASTLDFWKNFKRRIKAQHPNALLIGESFADIPVTEKYFVGGRGLDAAFDFGFHLLLADAFRSSDEKNSQDATSRVFSSIRDAIWENLKNKANSSAPIYYFANAISNHDLDRTSVHYKSEIIRAKQAAAMLLTLPGLPYIYYGEEIALPQYRSGSDIFRRAPMHWTEDKNAGFTSNTSPWVDHPEWVSWLTEPHAWWTSFYKNPAISRQHNVSAQNKNEQSLLNFYRKLIKIRNNIRELRHPETVKLFNTTGPSWVMEYRHGSDASWVIINLNADAPVTIDLPPELNGQFVEQITGKPTDLFAELELMAGDVRIYKTATE